MFKKLKEKITEEVKSSPQRFAEFTQSVSDKLQNNSSIDENFFSIGEDDANTPVNSAEHGFSSVSLVSPSQESRPRRNSNTSIASDISFLPRYESGSMYHLQSDLDVSASELEDNASTASSQIGHLSKEQIYSAFQKSQLRYHKYRGRYTDLARHYQELERENGKMKSVLVETQDKAIRRVTELKEQCGLEQKAKAHLEAALRDDIDEKNFKIHSLQTQIGLLQGADSADLLINIDSKDNSQTEHLENLTKYLNDARREIETLNERIQEMKANSIVFQSKEQEYKMKIATFEKEINQYSEREKENNLKLAQNKMELHNELLSKDNEISGLKKDNEVLKQKLETVENENKTNGGVKMENLQSQNKKLIDKVESLTQKCNNLENELLKVEKYKLEIRELNEREEQLKGELDSLSKENVKLKDNLTKEKKELENQILAIREDAKKGLLSLEPKIREKLQNEYLQREEDLKREFARKLEEISLQNNGEKDVQMQLFEKDDYIETLTAELELIKRELSKKVDEYCNLEKNHLELIEDSTNLRNTIARLEKENMNLANYEEKIGRLEAHIATLQEELKEITDVSEKKEKEIVYLSQENMNLQLKVEKTVGKLRVYEEKYEAIQLESSESKLLELKVQKLEEEQQALLDEFETERKMYNEMLQDHKDLKEKDQIISEMGDSLHKIRREMNHLSDNLNLEREKNVQLYDKKHNLELEVEKLHEKLRIIEEKGEAFDMEAPESGLLKLKLQALEEESRNLQESFEDERQTFENELDDMKQDLTTNDVFKDETDERCPMEKLRGKLHDVRRLSEHKEEDNIYLAQENMGLQQENEKMVGKLRVLEEKLEAVQMEGTESKLLELKVDELEKQNENMGREFEMERKMFNNILESDKELVVKEEIIAQLQEDLSDRHQDIIKIMGELEGERTENINLGKRKLILEKAVEKLTEKVRIAEEREEAVALDNSEVRMLEMKLGRLEEENRLLQENFETERKCFEKFYEDNSKNEVKIRELMEENAVVKQLIEKEKASHMKNKKIFEEHQSNLKKIEELEGKIEAQEERLKGCSEESESNVKKLDGITTENQELRKELEEKDNQVLELSKNIAKLSEVIQKQTIEFNSLLKRTQQLESVLEKIQIDSADAIKREKERQNELTLKIEELQRELEEKTNKFSDLSEKLSELEKLYAEEKSNYKEKTEEIDTLRKKIVELQALEETYRMIGKEKRVVDDELLRLKVVENDFKALQNEKLSLENKVRQVENELKAKSNEFRVTEQSCNILREEKDGLLAEIKNLRVKIEELSAENGNLRAASARFADSEYALEQLKNQNEVLQTENDSLSKEISELNLRISQISSDNRAVEDENHSLGLANEELKIRLEALESEKGRFGEVETGLVREKEELVRTVEEVERKLSDVRRQNLELENDRNVASSNGLDISRIQQDFYEIKEKCDSLFVENKSLKSEYAKLEEKCNDFSKIRKKLETQITELEHQYSDIQHEKQLLQDEIQELKISPVNVRGGASKLDQLEILKRVESFTTEGSRGPGHHIDKEKFLNEIETLQEKLTQYKSLDITNKSSIEFYENELQKMKNQNEKLNRKLDETLVTLNHCAELSTSTEVEYLKNVLYNYMLGKESLVLARVIAAVCKFDPEQTETVLQREQQKQTLLGQLGLI